MLDKELRVLYFGKKGNEGSIEWCGPLLIGREISCCREKRESEQTGCFRYKTAINEIFIYTTVPIFSVSGIKVRNHLFPLNLLRLRY